MVDDRESRDRNIPRIALPVIIAPLVLLSWLLLLLMNSEMLSDALAVIVVLIGGSVMVYGALREIAHRNFSVDFLASIAVFSAALIHEFLPAAIVVLMLLGGQAIEEYAAGRSSRAIDELTKIRPTSARMLFDGREMIVPIEEVKADAVVVVKPGDRIPVDGEVVSGRAMIDQSSITGESLPAEKVVGNLVLSGTICLDGTIHVKTTRIGEETKFARIIRLVRQAQASKAPVQRVADRYAQWFTPIVLALAIAVYFFTGQLVRSVTVLLVASPCPLLLATPVSVISTIGRAAKLGILVKNGRPLEVAGSVNTIVFDKTGTLTYGRLKVVHIEPFGASEEEIAKYAGITEVSSNHPIAQAIVSYASENGVKPAYPDSFKEFAGEGAAADYHGHHFLIGNRRFMDRQRITVPLKVQSFLSERDDLPETILLLARDQSVIGAIGLADVLKPDSKEALERLRQIGIKRISILTGDTRRVAKKIAESIAVSDIRSELLPEEKVQAIEEMKRHGDRVAMIGDGINDAPALVTADVGIAMGAAGSDIAIETADFTIMTDDLLKVSTAIKLSRRMLRTAKQSITIGLLTNLVGVTLSIFGFLNPILGATLHEVADLFVIFNSARAFASKI